MAYVAPPVTRGVVVGYGYMLLNEIVPAATRLADLVNKHMLHSKSFIQIERAN